VPHNNVSFSRDVSEPRVLNLGSQIVAIRKDFTQQVNACIYPTHLLKMTEANSAINWTLRCAEFLDAQAANMSLKAQVHIIETTPFCLLLGQPLQIQVLPTLNVNAVCVPAKLLLSPANDQASMLVHSNITKDMTPALLPLSIPTKPSPHDATLSSSNRDPFYGHEAAKLCACFISHLFTYLGVPHLPLPSSPTPTPRLDHFIATVFWTHGDYQKYTQQCIPPSGIRWSFLEPLLHACFRL
jgi:hypothetical protein